MSYSPASARGVDPLIGPL